MINVLPTRKKVFGIPDDRLGEVVCAAITITKGSTVDEETVKNYCNGNVSDFIVIYYYATCELMI